MEKKYAKRKRHKYLLAKKAAKKVGIPALEMIPNVEKIFEVIKEELGKGGEVSIPNFGTFRLRNYCRQNVCGETKGEGLKEIGKIKKYASLRYSNYVRTVVENPRKRKKKVFGG